MSNVSKQIYRKINSLIPDLHKIEPFTKVDLKTKGFSNIHIVMLDSNPDEINFILTRYDNGNGSLVANPAIEIVADPKKQTANVLTFKDPNYFHSTVAKPNEIGTIALCEANRFLYNWLVGLTKQKIAHSNDNSPPKTNFSRWA